MRHNFQILIVYNVVVTLCAYIYSQMSQFVHDFVLRLDLCTDFIQLKIGEATSSDLKDKFAISNLISYGITCARFHNYVSCKSLTSVFCTTY